MREGPRTFARWRRETPTDPSYTQIPADGACLSAFVLVSPADRPAEVLLGEPNPRADWSRIGALDPHRAERAAGHWMLPSSHLQTYEAPDAAAQRIVREQLELPDLVLTGPTVVSDDYARPGAPDRHWDLDFLYRATWPRGRPVGAAPWNRLEFVDPRTVPAARFTRSHEDILRFAGFATAP